MYSWTLNHWPKYSFLPFATCKSGFVISNRLKSELSVTSLSSVFQHIWRGRGGSWHRRPCNSQRAHSATPVAQLHPAGEGERARWVELCEGCCCGKGRRQYVIKSKMLLQFHSAAISLEIFFFYCIGFELQHNGSETEQWLWVCKCQVLALIWGKGL